MSYLLTVSTSLKLTLPGLAHPENPCAHLPYYYSYENRYCISLFLMTHLFASDSFEIKLKLKREQNTLNFTATTVFTVSFRISGHYNLILSINEQTRSYAIL